MPVTRFAASIGVALSLACSSSSGSSLTGPAGGTGGGPTADITIQDFSFSPATLTVKVGTTVRWTNKGPSAHTTTSDMGTWTSGTLGAPTSAGGYGGGGSAGGSFTFTFNQAGTYGYHCSIHPPAQYPGFTGTVMVTP